MIWLEHELCIQEDKLSSRVFYKKPEGENRRARLIKTWESHIRDEVRKKGVKRRGEIRMEVQDSGGWQTKCKASAVHEE